MSGDVAAKTLLNHALQVLGNAGNALIEKFCSVFGQVLRIIFLKSEGSGPPILPLGYATDPYQSFGALTLLFNWLANIPHSIFKIIMIYIDLYTQQISQFVYR